MATDTPESESRRVVATCPSCGARCRVREDAPQGSAHCPKCGAALSSAPRRSESSAGRRPQAGGAVAAKPSRRPSPSLPEVELEEEPERPEPPAHPLLQGVYGYPWHMRHLRAWFWFGLGFTFMALLGAAVWHVFILYHSSSEVGRNIYFRVLILFWKGLVVSIFWTGMFTSPYVLEVIQQTAGGNDEFRPPDTTLGEKLVEFLYLVWITVLAATLPAVAGVAVERVTQVPFIGYDVALLLFIIVFPQLLLGSLVNDSAFMLLSGDVMAGLLKRPLVLLGFTLASVLVLGVPLVLGVVTVLGLNYFLAPIAGYVCAASLLIYARLLGRVGWVLTYDGAMPRRGRRRKKRKRVAAE